MADEIIITEGTAAALTAFAYGVARSVCSPRGERRPDAGPTRVDAMASRLEDSIRGAVEDLAGRGRDVVWMEPWDRRLGGGSS